MISYGAFVMGLLYQCVNPIASRCAGFKQYTMVDEKNCKKNFKRGATWRTGLKRATKWSSKQQMLQLLTICKYNVRHVVTTSIFVESQSNESPIEVES